MRRWGLRLSSRGLNRRRDRLGLPGRIGHRHRIGDVVDDNGVVNVVVDEVIRRRRNVLRGIYVHRYRHINRNGKNVFVDRRRWRSQIDEEDRPRRQENDRRRRWLKSEIRIVENQYRPFDVNDLLRWRRRHIVGDDIESRRRLERGRQKCKPAPRIVGMGAAGITAQIRPVGGRCIDGPSMTPRDGFAAGCHNGSHASCHRIVGIGGKEVFIILQSVAIESREIGFPRVKVTDRPRSYRCGLFRRNLGRRCIRCPLKKVKRRLQL